MPGEARGVHVNSQGRAVGMRVQVPAEAIAGQWAFEYRLLLIETREGWVQGMCVQMPGEDRGLWHWASESK